MGVYHITYTPELKEICLYLDCGCNFSCHGCISKYHPEDCHLDKETRQIKNRTLDIDAYIAFNNDKFRRPTGDEMNKAKIIAERYLDNVHILHKEIKVRYPVKRIY